MKTAYAWEENGKFYLSLFARDKNKAKNEYATQAQLLQEAAQRGLTVKWQ